MVLDMTPDREWTQLAGPNTPPRVEIDTDVKVRVAPLSFFVRADALWKIKLPRAWANARVSRLVELLAVRAGVSPWDCHLVGCRGALPADEAIFAEVTKGSTLHMQRGPAPNIGTPTSREVLWIWGRCVDGTLCPTPTRQPGVGAHRVVRVAMGAEHVAALTRAGLVLSWGQNDMGQLGTGAEFPSSTPRLVRALADRRVSEIACGPRCSGASIAKHSMAEHSIA